MSLAKPRKTPAAPALVALCRAAKAALAKARQTGTPCYVLIDDKIVDRAKAKPAGRRKASRG